MTEHNNPQDNLTVPRELLRQAEELLSSLITYDWHNKPKEDIDKEGYECAEAIRAALEQPAVEPVGWCHLQYNKDGTSFADCLQHFADTYANVPLYTAPQAQQPTNQFNPDWDQVKPFLDRIAELEQELKTTTDALGHAQRQHVTDGSVCWCNPTMTYKDPDTGAEVWVHQEPQ